MAKMLKCGDLMPGCTVVIEGKDENEVMAKASEHARQKHGVYSVSPDMAAKAKAAIIDVCVNNRHQRGARVLFEYETTGKPRGVGAPTAPRGRPLEGGRRDHGGRPAARMFPQFGHPVA